MRTCVTVVGAITAGIAGLLCGVPLRSLAFGDAVVSPDVLRRYDERADTFIGQSTWHRKGTGVVAGKVVDQTGAGVANATARITVDGASAVTFTNTSGGFAFDGLPFGRGAVLVSKRGFVSSYYGQGSAPNSPIGWAAVGRAPTSLTVRLRRGGAIEGVARTHDGRPVTNVVVTAVRSLTDPDWGSLFLTIQGAAHLGLRPIPNAHAVTNGDGAFRLDDIEDGTYTLVASPARDFESGPPTPYFFPGTTDPDKAQYFHVARDARVSASITLERVERVQLHVRVLTADGVPAAHAVVRFIRLSGGTPVQACTSVLETDSHGEVRTSLVRGPYVSISSSRTPWITPGVDQPVEATYRYISVTDRSNDRIDILLQRPAAVMGRVLWGDVSPVRQLRVSATRIDGVPTIVGSAPVSETGQFLLHNIFGPVTLHLGGGVVNFVPETVRDGRVSSVLSITEGTVAHVTVRAGREDHVTGVVTDGSRRVPDAVVLYFPVSASHAFKDGLHELRATRSSESGDFDLRGLSRESYYAVALADVDLASITAHTLLALSRVGSRLTIDQAPQHAQLLLAAAHR